MSTFSQQSIGARWRLASVIAVGYVAGSLAVLSAPAQESETPVLIASLSASTMTPEFILNSVRERPDRPAPPVIDRIDRPMPVPHRKPTDSDAWDRFEAEYRPELQNPSLIKHHIETAKYGLDVTVFALDRFIKSIRNNSDFELNDGNLHRTQTNSRDLFPVNPHVKLDFDMTHGHPYLGARVVIPFGN